MNVHSMDSGAFDESDNDDGDSYHPSSKSEDRYREFIGEFVRGDTRFRGTVRLFVNDKDEEELLKEGRRQKARKTNKSDRVPRESNKVNGQSNIPVSREAPQVYYNIQPASPPQ